MRIFASTHRSGALPSLHDLLNIVKAVTAFSVVLLIVDYVLVSPQVLHDFFFGKVTIAVYWVVQVFLLSGPRIGFRLFRHYRTQKKADAVAIRTLVLGCAADAEVLVRAVESGAVKKIRPVGILSPSDADQRQVLRGIKILGRLDSLESVVRKLESRGSSIEEVVFTPSALLPENQPQALLDTARKLGLTVRATAVVGQTRGSASRAGAGRGSVVAAHCHNQLQPPGAVRGRQGGDRHRRRRIDRLGTVRARSGF